MEGNLMTVKEACIYLNISKSTLLRLRNNKEIKYIKINDGNIRFKKEDLDSFIESKRI